MHAWETRYNQWFTLIIGGEDEKENIMLKAMIKQTTEKDKRP